MQLIKRLPLVVPAAVIAQLIFAPTAAAFLPGNGLLAAGNYHITTQTADYFSCCGTDTSLPNVSVDVTDTTTVANPLVGPSTVSHETDVEIFACGGSLLICGGGCFVAGATDFTGSGLSSAVLNTAFDPATSPTCQDRPVPFDAFTVNVNWSGTGAGGSSRQTSTYSCAPYAAEVQTLNSGTSATASASVSLAAGALPTDSARLGTIDQRWQAQGVAQDACSSLGLGGGGKGAGPGPRGTGGFEFISQTANASIPGGFVSLGTFSNVFRPTGTPPSTAGDTELAIRNFSTFTFLCFVLQGSNTFSFGSGLSGASVHAVIDQNTPACPQGGNGFFEPFTVDFTWTATGPLASIRNITASGCGTFKQQQLNTDATNPAGASGTVSMFSSDPISATDASLNSSDHHIQIEGTKPQSCSLQT